MSLATLLLGWLALTCVGVAVLVALEPHLTGGPQRAAKRTGTCGCARAHIEVSQPGSALSS